MNTKLFTYPILTLTFSLSCLLTNSPSVNSQSSAYSCERYQGGFAIFGRSSLGDRPIIIWDNRQELCNTISKRFQVARDNGNLRFLLIDINNNNICGTDREGGECRNLLFSTDTAENARFLWGRLRNGNTIESRFITESEGREYFNLELYLETEPIAPNQEVLVNY